MIAQLLCCQRLTNARLRSSSLALTRDNASQTATLETEICGQRVSTAPQVSREDGRIDLAERLLPRGRRPLRKVSVGRAGAGRRDARLLLCAWLWGATAVPITER